MSSRNAHKPGPGGSQVIVLRPDNVVALHSNLVASRVATWAPPPLSAYEDWIAARGHMARSRHSLRASQMRRMVIIVHYHGVSFMQAARTMGLNSSTGSALEKRLPEELK